MPINDPEIPALFGALDSAAVGDGTAASALMLRQLARGANRLICQGGPMLNLIFDASVVGGEGVTTGVLSGYATPEWRRAYWGPIVVPNKQSLRNYSVQVVATIPATRTVYLQIGSKAHPFRADADITNAPNVITMASDGTTNQLFTKSALHLGLGPYEAFEFWIAGDRTADDPSGYGGSASGTVDQAGLLSGGAEGFFFVDESQTWNRTTTPRLDDGSVSVIFENAAGDRIAGPFKIVSVSASGTTAVTTGNTLTVDARGRIDPQFLVGTTYRLKSYFEWRIQGIAVYSDDRTVA
jgi:hypothetical protein